MTPDALAAIIPRHARREGPLLPILHDVQAAQGWIAEPDMVVIAHALNLSRAEVSGVVSFYHDFRRGPPAKAVVRLCRAEACQARGVEALLRAVQPPPSVEIETVYCLGLCSVGPAAMVGDAVHARLDAPGLAALIERAAA